MTAGVLIIGSLLWDKGKGCGREVWRRDRLRIEQGIGVPVPIRYGRRSGERGDTYTMTFADEAKSGGGILVPCLMPLGGFDDLRAEAEALWRAERPDASEGEIGRKWGCVGVWFRDHATAPSWATDWKAHFRRKVCRPSPPVDKGGVLRMKRPGPVVADPSLDLDVILATATRSEEPPPSAEQVAIAWVGQTSGHERYFFENVRNEIRTADDLAIWRTIEKRNPGWLAQPEYAEAVRVLREEAAQEAGACE